MVRKTETWQDIKTNEALFELNEALRAIDSSVIPLGTKTSWVDFQSAYIYTLENLDRNDRHIDKRALEMRVNRAFNKLMIVNMIKLQGGK